MNWHIKGTHHYLCNDEERILGWVRPSLGNYYAETSNRQHGEYLSVEAAKRAVEQYITQKVTA